MWFPGAFKYLFIKNLLCYALQHLGHPSSYLESSLGRVWYCHTSQVDVQQPLTPALRQRLEPWGELAS